jgi:hypothetical protein
VDHHPLIEPLSILDHKLDTTTDPPTPMVLVQWAGLPLEDTSWESWETLQQTYHLEDKVNFADQGDVSTTANVAQTTNETQPNHKPKRITNRPIHLKDYV